MKVSVGKTFTVNVGNYESYKLEIRVELDSDEVEGGHEMLPEELGALCIQSIDNLATPQLKAFKAKVSVPRDSFIHRY